MGLYAWLTSSGESRKKLGENRGEPLVQFRDQHMAVSTIEDKKYSNLYWKHVEMNPPLKQEAGYK